MNFLIVYAPWVAIVLAFLTITTIAEHFKGL